MITIKIMPYPTKQDRDFIFSLVHFYKGFASSLAGSLICIEPSGEFNSDSLIRVLKTCGYIVEIIEK